MPHARKQRFSLAITAQKAASMAVLLSAAWVVGPASAGDFRLSSPDLQAGSRLAEKQVFKGFGCTGGNVSPELAWQDAPPGTKSFALTFYDPDAPTGSGWWHWVVFNIPAQVHGLAAGAGDLAAASAPHGAVQSRTDFGTPGYGGPCPPVGDKPHRYRFTVHALGVERLPLDANASGAMVGFYLTRNSIGTAVLEGVYSR